MTNRLHKEIEGLKQQILTLVAEVEENLRVAVTALEDRNLKLANEVIENDLRVDQMEVDLEEECLKILALYQPVATDLRFIITVLKINNDLERISDLAVNIAERASFLVSAKHINAPFDFTAMAKQAQNMVRKSINALVTLNVKSAYDVCMDDDIIDTLNREVYDIIAQAIKKNPSNVVELIYYLGVSRHLERVADHATNIAEDVIYLIDGEIIRHHRTEFKKK